MRNTLATIAVLVATLLAAAVTATDGASAAMQPRGQDGSAGPYNPGIPRD
jgi:hypothetical protein